MKTIEEFGKGLIKHNIKEDEIRNLYKKYEVICFNKYLNTLPIEDINKLGIDIWYKIWSAFDISDR